MHDIRSAQLYELHELQQGVQKCAEPGLGQNVWFYKIKDKPRMGNLLATILKKIGSNFKVQISNGGKITISNQRLFLIYGKNYGNK